MSTTTTNGLPAPLAQLRDEAAPWLQTFTLSGARVRDDERARLWRSLVECAEADLRPELHAYIDWRACERLFLDQSDHTRCCLTVLLPGCWPIEAWYVLPRWRPGRWQRHHMVGRPADGGHCSSAKWLVLRHAGTAEQTPVMCAELGAALVYAQIKEAEHAR